MDTSFIISIIIAIIALVSGIYALVTQQNKTNSEKIAEASAITNYFHKENSENSDRIYRLEVQANTHSDLIGNMIENSTLTTDDLWKKMYEKSVIMPCKYCDYPNVITNLSCTQCGAPL